MTPVAGRGGFWSSTWDYRWARGVRKNWYPWVPCLSSLPPSTVTSCKAHSHPVTHVSGGAPSIRRDSASVLGSAGSQARASAEAPGETRLYFPRGDKGFCSLQNWDVDATGCLRFSSS